MHNKLRSCVRSVYRIIGGVNGFIYDFVRYVKYSGWRSDPKIFAERNYLSAMLYHGLEKSLSYKVRNPASGWRNVEQLIELIEVADNLDEAGFHDKATVSVVREFLQLPENTNSARAEVLKKKLSNVRLNCDELHGAINFDLSDFNKGRLSDPESFFSSRYSLREYSGAPIEDELIVRALNLAIKTPSVCNRQPWAIYHTSAAAVKEVFLNIQSGNKPFGEKIPNLIIVAVDLRAFFAGSEHYQHWIDGGMFSMSIIYALHSLGLASCPLNWSQTPANDRKVRALLNIKPYHTIMMAIACGYPSEKNKVCVSARRPVDDFYNELQSIK